MGYVESSLSPGEVIVFRAIQHWIFFWRRICFVATCITLAIAALVARSKTSDDLKATAVGPFASTFLGIIVFALLSTATVYVVLIALRRLRLEYAVTTKRVVIKRGLVWRNTLEIALPKVESVMVEQGVLGRLLGYGDIVIKGSAGTIEPFVCVMDPLGFRSAVESNRSK